MVLAGPEGWKTQPSRRHLTWFLLARIAVITIFLGGAIFFQLRAGMAGGHPALGYLYGLIVASYLHALASVLSLPRLRNLVFFTQTQIAWDLLFCFCLIYVTGGVDSLFSFSFVFVIIAASVFFSWRDILLVASASAILYGGLVDFQYYGQLPVLPGLPLSQEITGQQAFSSIFVHVAGFLLTALLCAALAERWRRSEQALQAQKIDYDELEALNRVILENISSGLMIVNEQGRIRSFNRAAEQITGFALQQVYNRDVRELFPRLDVFGEDGYRTRQRAEADIVDAEGQVRTLGYAASLIRDPQERLLGLLVSFQDLTMVKEMEERLRRADRLAAVGRLASAMAHEIRNPLASISGSVQLLMEGENVSDQDRRLMGIVVREAERLSGLLTDFLAYARPKKPQAEVCDLRQLLAEALQVCRSDPRFAAVEVEVRCPEGARFLLDHDQIRQVIWDLLINAAEAMQQRGRIRVSVDPDSGGIAVEDDGPGVPVELRERIFEPFFTTKPGGTGLGLATVHGIVEAHGGQLIVGKGELGGACFRILLGRQAVLN
ncbi:two-component system sensor histidine kinase PilS (NtrC family) [Geothermobacter ehrlichii]|uniref:histidine kinase n=1 Tax=Geothermobacter ehrlichii TaxID=213224 RepID=A0A5D3WM66_9BACT|nr:ATP-binding protein [Geothermobacter ehrlichii]TYO99940.1 two-component system sensor histidine kinase PilS (NtrC family) [Geothermobacter ehrlichii]